MVQLLEESLVTFLRAQADITDVVENRIFPQYKAQDVKTPCITYFRVVGTHHDSLYGGSGLQSVRIQIDCWGDYKEVKELAEIVRKKMQGYQGLWGDRTIQGCRYLTDNDFGADEDMAFVNEFRVSMDFEVWTDEGQEIYNT